MEENISKNVAANYLILHLTKHFSRIAECFISMSGAIIFSSILRSPITIEQSSTSPGYRLNLASLDENCTSSVTNLTIYAVFPSSVFTVSGLITATSPRIGWKYLLCVPASLINASCPTVTNPYITYGQFRFNHERFVKENNFSDIHFTGATSPPIVDTNNCLTMPSTGDFTTRLPSSSSNLEAGSHIFVPLQCIFEFDY